MHLQNLPRGSLAARFAVLDLVDRLGNNKDSDLRHAVTVVSSYLLSDESEVTSDQLSLLLPCVEKLYSGL